VGTNINYFSDRDYLRCYFDNTGAIGMKHTGLGQRPPRTFNITVTSGTGSLELKFGGTCIGVSVLAPNGTAVYDLVIEDGDAFHVFQALALTGHQIVRDEFQMYYDTADDSGMTLKIENATDGAYKVRLWFKV